MAYPPLTLAQTLAPPPLIPHYLLEQPWPLAIFLLAIAAAVTLVARRAGRPGLRWVGRTLAIAAIGVVVLGYTVTTTREHLIQRTATLVHATAPMDWPTFDAMVRDDLRVTWADGSLWVQGDQAKNMLRRYPPQSQTVRDMDAQLIDPTHAHTLLNLRTQLGGKAAGLPMHTLWQLTWQRDSSSGPWHLAAARWLRWQGKPAHALPGL